MNKILFKKDQRVQCIKNSNYEDRLTVRKIYIVDKDCYNLNSSSVVKIRKNDIGTEDWLFASRFIDAEKVTKKSSPMIDFAAGDTVVCVNPYGRNKELYPGYTYNVTRIRNGRVELMGLQKDFSCNRFKKFKLKDVVKYILSPNTARAFLLGEDVIVVNSDILKNGTTKTVASYLDKRRVVLTDDSDDGINAGHYAFRFVRVTDVLDYLGEKKLAQKLREYYKKVHANGGKALNKKETSSSIKPAEIQPVFNKGDLLKAKPDANTTMGGHTRLTPGKIYKAQNNSNQYVKVINDLGDVEPCYIQRFEKVQPECNPAALTWKDVPIGSVGVDAVGIKFLKMDNGRSVRLNTNMVGHVGDIFPDEPMKLIGKVVNIVEAI